MLRAHFLSRLAVLRIVTIASYSSSSRLAIHDKKRTLYIVQLRILGLTTQLLNQNKQSRFASDQIN